MRNAAPDKKLLARRFRGSWDFPGCKEAIRSAEVAGGLRRSGRGQGVGAEAESDFWGN